jgi:hypothetical protein
MYYDRVDKFNLYQYKYINNLFYFYDNPDIFNHYINNKMNNIKNEKNILWCKNYKFEKIDNKFIL